MSLYVNADWSALVPAGSPEAAFGITAQDAKRRGLVPLEPDEKLDERTVLRSANLLPPRPEIAPEPVPEPEAKEAPKPADKSMKRPRTK